MSKKRYIVYLFSAFQIHNCCSTTRFSAAISSFKSMQLKTLNIKLREFPFKSYCVKNERKLECETMGC